MDFQVLKESDHNESSPFYQRMRFDQPDPVQKQIFLLNNPNALEHKDGVNQTHEHELMSSQKIRFQPNKRARSVVGGPLFPKNPEANWGPKKST
eukprot:CAMPEP_0179465398 /NCGR_PEP_ID=MMETSP0799-20121207/46960_1 /TAXON_ID=46947 /ORGANISM="Geminigera cryophila, Strain CCMP2564" /LENGTH=93 /DNA_ID=CAMNT_0021269633 /DNA_START=168 /DNA_END=446 /DNA_ORIENTATION=+